DPHPIDELRLASRHQLELAVASRDDILTELRRLARQSEAFGARAALAEEEALLEEEEEADDLEAEDGISEAPLVRLVNSIIFQAAEDGASDVHFEPQEDALLGPRRDQSSGDQHHHGRGPGRVPPRRNQPGTDQYPRRPHVRGGAAVDPALRPRRRDGRRDPRPRDRQDLDRGRPYRSLRAL